MKIRNIRNYWRQGIITASVIALIGSPGISSMYHHFNSVTISRSAESPSSSSCISGHAEAKTVKKIAEDMFSETKNELEQDGVKLNEIPSTSELERAVDETLPHIAAVLKRDVVHRPKAKFVNYLAHYELARYSPFTDYVVLDSKAADRSKFKGLAAHEVFHAQVNGSNVFEVIRHAYSGILPGYFRYFDETLATMVSYEVLARMAINGDKLAKHNFGNKLVLAFEKFYTDIPTRNHPRTKMYFTIPAGIIVDTVACNTDEYKGIKLPAVRELIQKNLK